MLSKDNEVEKILSKTTIDVFIAQAISNVNNNIDILHQLLQLKSEKFSAGNLYGLSKDIFGMHLAISDPIFQALLAHSHINPNEKWALILLREAIRNHAIKSAELLLPNVSDINALSEYRIYDLMQGGATPLMFAVCLGDKLLIKLLLDNKADVNIQNEYGESALNLLAKTKFDDIQKKEIESLLMTAATQDNVGYLNQYGLFKHELKENNNVLPMTFQSTLNN